LLPDADEQHSTINKHIPLHYGKLVYAIGAAALFYQAYKTSNLLLVVPAIVSLLIYISGHRGFTHSIFACGLMGLPLLSDFTRFVQFTVSYLAHLICDMLNTKGIQLLYPLQKRYKLPINFTMDSVLGRSVELMVVVISGVVIIKSYI
jgi:inner membrane protein